MVHIKAGKLNSHKSYISYYKFIASLLCDNWIVPCKYLFFSRQYNVKSCQWWMQNGFSLSVASKCAVLAVLLWSVFWCDLATSWWPTARGTSPASSQHTVAHLDGFRGNWYISMKGFVLTKRSVALVRKDCPHFPSD